MRKMHWLLGRADRFIPRQPEKLLTEWGRVNVKLPGSARSEQFDPDLTRWICQPLDCLNNGITRRMTFVKPVQCGGSTVGEVAICYLLANGSGGDLQYNWENDDKAGERWDKRIEKIIRACKPVMERWPLDRNKAKRGMVVFPHMNLTVQGVHADANLDSDSVRYQFNEEIHNWDAGKLDLAYTRGTAYWNSLAVNISNASNIGDQLHEALTGGTNRQWETPCPGCGAWHAMHIATERDKPGGLRYNSEGCKRPDDSYDYVMLAPTIYYEFPCCGYKLHDDATERRKLSAISRYSEPRNAGALEAHESFTLESVSVDYIPFIDLIQEKHKALKAMKYGDLEPWMKYLKRRECKFWDPEDLPIVGRVQTSPGLKKDRAGMMGHDNFAFRFFACDRQQGEARKGELPHWWLVIRDFLKSGDSLLVFEGKLETDGNVIDTLDRHSCIRRHGVADTGWDTEHVYAFCLRYGINAVKGGKAEYYAHENRVRRIFEPERPLHAMRGMPPTQELICDEPHFWHYAKNGIANRLEWLRSSKTVKWEVPSDVSQDYKSHMESEQIRAGQWVQVKKRNDLLVCERYISMQAEMAGLISNTGNETQETHP